MHDAKNRFRALVEAVLAGAPQEMSRRGKATVVVVAATDYQRLVSQARGARGSFADHLLSFPSDGGDLERADVRPRDVQF